MADRMVLWLVDRMADRMVDRTAYQMMDDWWAEWPTYQRMADGQPDRFTGWLNHRPTD